MRHRNLAILLLAIPLIGGVWLGKELLADAEPAKTKVKTQKASPQEREQNQDTLSEARPEIDREPFRKSALSAARGDLLACRNANPQITRPGRIDAERFARNLNGVWLNENRRTVHGMPVETDAAFYISMDGLEGVGILIDRNNMADNKLAAPFKSGNHRLAKDLAMTQVNCPFEFVDQYIKVTDDVPVQALAASTGIRLPRGSNLVDAWQALVESGYFERLEMPTDENGSLEVITAKLGDEQRVAILPQGIVVTERDIEEGRAPGAEYELPMLTGGIFRITVEQIEPNQGAPYGGVQMRWDAEYRGAGIGLAPGEAAYGIERGQFFAEGDAFVAARDAVFPAGSAGATTATVESTMEGWETSTCGDKNQMLQLSEIEMEEVETLRLATGEERTVDVTPEFVFERFVIGTPG